MKKLILIAGLLFCSNVHGNVLVCEYNKGHEVSWDF